MSQERVRDKCVAKRKMPKAAIPLAVIGISAVLVGLLNQNNHTDNRILMSDEYLISQTQINENAVETIGIEESVEVAEIESKEVVDNDSENSDEIIEELDVVNAYINDNLHLIKVR